MNNTPLRGLTPTLASLFYPSWTWKGARHGNMSTGPETREVPQQSQPPGASSASTQSVDRSLGGIPLGLFVERELSQIVELLNQVGMTVSGFLEEKPHFRLGTPRRARQALSGFRVTMHRYTRMLLEALVVKQWHPLRCQVNCGSADARLGTAVDLVCRDESDARRRGRGHDVLVEIKCGYVHYLHRYVDMMKPPYAHLPDSSFFQIQLQMAFTRILYMRTYRQRCVSGVHALMVHDGGVMCFPLKAKVKASDSEGWKQLVATHRTLAYQRTKARKEAQRQALEDRLKRDDAKVVCLANPVDVRRAQARAPPKKKWHPRRSHSRPTHQPARRRTPIRRTQSRSRSRRRKKRS